MELPELWTIVARDAAPAALWPQNSIAFNIDVAAGTLSLHSDPSRTLQQADVGLTVLIKADACRRMFNAVPAETATWHLPNALRNLAVSAYDYSAQGAAREVFRLAKGIEILCATFDAIREGSLIQVTASDLSEADARRISAARAFIDERWREKLTLDLVARACGLNRAKLTRGFRSTYSCSVTDAIAERRMTGAREMLLGTDLPVSSIGHQCGYLNNASFARAFSRRFGLAPTRLRADRIAA